MTSYKQISQVSTTKLLCTSVKARHAFSETHWINRKKRPKINTVRSNKMSKYSTKTSFDTRKQHLQITAGAKLRFCFFSSIGSWPLLPFSAWCRPKSSFWQAVLLLRRLSRLDGLAFLLFLISEDVWDFSTSLSGHFADDLNFQFFVFLSQDVARGGHLAPQLFYLR